MFIAVSRGLYLKGPLGSDNKTERLQTVTEEITKPETSTKPKRKYKPLPVKNEYLV